MTVIMFIEFFKCTGYVFFDGVYFYGEKLLRIQTDDLDRRTNFPLECLHGSCCWYLGRNLCRRRERVEAHMSYIYTLFLPATETSLGPISFLTNKNLSLLSQIW